MSSNSIQIIACPFCDWSMARSPEQHDELVTAYSAHLDTH